MKTGSAIILGSAAVMAVLWATAAPRQPQPEPTAVTPIPRSEAERAADEVRAQRARLQVFLDRAPAPSAGTRNPFQYAAVAPLAPAPEPIAPAPPVPAEPPLPTAPSLHLIGMAEEVTDDGITRTAIISSDGHLFMVKVGDRVTDRYLVTAVGADAVELSDRDTGSVRRLGLR